jgi:hypothetical protein
MTSLLAPNIPVEFSPDKVFADFLKEHGSPIGKGTTRRVYDIAGTDYVLKVTSKHSTTPNWREITAFLKFGDIANIARIISWSDSGRCLVMEKLNNVGSVSTINFQWPTWVTDRKPSSVGQDSSGNLKMCDYALVIVGPQITQSPYV